MFGERTGEIQKRGEVDKGGDREIQMFGERRDGLGWRERCLGRGQERLIRVERESEKERDRCLRSGEVDKGGEREKVMFGERRGEVDKGGERGKPRKRDDL